MPSPLAPPVAESSPKPGAPIANANAARLGEERAFGVLALIALGTLIRLAAPVGVGLFLGVLLGFTVEPIYLALRRKRFNPGPAALLCALGAALVVAAIVVALTSLIVARGVVLVGVLRSEMAPGGSLRGSAEQILGKLQSLHLNVGNMSQRLENEAISLGSRAPGVAAGVAGATFGGLLTLFFMTLATYFVVRHWDGLVLSLERTLPFDTRHTRSLLQQFRRVGREVFFGTIVTGLVQGLFAAFGYWITGVPEPAFFGALTALGSLIPGVGTLLVWVPVGAVQIATGHAGAGLAQLVYSALTVGIASDYVIRPRLVGREQSVPTVLTFVGLFGGVEVFGVIGLIVGPIIVTLSFAVLKMYEQDVADRRPIEDKSETLSP